jgi:hypothetical protein
MSLIVTHNMFLALEVTSPPENFPDIRAEPPQQLAFAFALPWLGQAAIAALAALGIGASIKAWLDSAPESIKQWVSETLKSIWDGNVAAGGDYIENFKRDAGAFLNSLGIFTERATSNEQLQEELREAEETLAMLDRKIRAASPSEVKELIKLRNQLNDRINQIKDALREREVKV